MNDYGNGRSTCLDQTAAGKILTGFGQDDVRMSKEDRAVLRTLAHRVAAIAAGPRMEEVRALWRNINGLNQSRPAIFCDPENGWNEIYRFAAVRNSLRFSPPLIGGVFFCELSQPAAKHFTDFVEFF